MAQKYKMGMAAIFHTEAEIIKAATAVRKMGYTKFDAITPYPVHGMEEACGVQRSWIPYVAFVMAVVGLASGWALTWWTSAVDWPLNIGGKPFHSLPAFIPIMFELTILFSALSSVGALLYACGLPRINPPIVHPDLTCDKFGIFIPNDDTGFNEGKVEELFRSLGAAEIKRAEF
jgi:hypothetical protein